MQEQKEYDLTVGCNTVSSTMKKTKQMCVGIARKVEKSDLCIETQHLVCISGQGHK
jgi:hypothetical protein